MNFDIIDQYESFVTNNFIIKDKNQIKLLKDVYSTWVNSQKNSLIFKKEKKSGAYIHGKVGTGKTFLLNLICQFTKVGRKIHFNHLMNEIHNSINKKNKNEKTLEKFVKKLSLDVKILFIDELHIFNIADALIVKKIFDFFGKNKIFLLVSSNFQPNELYNQGLQREDFLPFINFINKNFKLIKLNNSVDYRRFNLNQTKTYFTPINDETKYEFKKLFNRFVDNSLLSSKTIKVKSRTITIENCIANVALCSFNSLCGKNLAHEDYKEIASNFTLFFIEDVPQFNKELSDKCRRFISLIDMLYEQNCSTVILAEAPINAMCQINQLSKEFERTASRLYEMTIIKQIK